MREGHGKQQLKEGLTYEGEFKGGEADGYGVLTQKQSLYIGQFKNGLFDGEGEWEDKDWHIKGQFSEGLRQGPGVLTCKKSSCTYRGKFSWDRRQGWFDVTRAAHDSTPADTKRVFYF